MHAGFCVMLERGGHFASSQVEAAFMSSAHGDAEIDAVTTAAGAVFQSL